VPCSDSWNCDHDLMAVVGGKDWTWQARVSASWSGPISIFVFFFALPCNAMLRYEEGMSEAWRGRGCFARCPTGWKRRH
jgi:hypothetical protein